MRRALLTSAGARHGRRLVDAAVIRLTSAGILTTIFVALCTLWTSHILCVPPSTLAELCSWRYCMAHPETTDIVRARLRGPL